MKLSGYICSALLVSSLVTLGSSFEPVTTIVVGAIIGVGSLLTVSLLEPIRCRAFPCCNSRWIFTDMTGLQYDLKWKLHGQHLASLMVFQYIKSHVTSEDPPKALVLSFHGPGGVGKTFVSQIIARNVYTDGLRSKFVHLISAVRDFPDERRLSEYKNELRLWIIGNLSVCERSMFIFEEVDKLPAGLLDVLVPFIVCGKYRKAIYILLSNTGGSDIVRATFDHRKSGRGRDTVQHSEMETMIMQAINEDKEYGLSQSRLISKNLVSAFIPFLPLEKEHVTMCISDAIWADHKLSRACPSGKVPAGINKNGEQKQMRCIPKQELVDGVMKHLTFSPRDEPMFSDMGCKRAVQKIYEVLD